MQKSYVMKIYLCIRVKKYSFFLFQELKYYMVVFLSKNYGNTFFVIDALS